MQPIRNEQAWRGFAAGVWRDEINVRDFIVCNLTPYAGGPDFLAKPSARALAVWDALQPYFREEIRKGVLDVDASTPATLTAFGPGYIDRDNEVIVGLQTDKPFKRAIMPTGGFRMVEAGLKAAGVEVDPAVRDIFTKYRKTHNDGIFDLYTPEIQSCRRSGIITGLPDAYGRGRIIGDYRRVALYGVDRLIEAKQAERAELDARWPTEEVMRLREEMADQLRALADLETMAASCLRASWLARHRGVSARRRSGAARHQVPGPGDLSESDQPGGRADVALRRAPGGDGQAGVGPLRARSGSDRRPGQRGGRGPLRRADEERRMGGGAALPPAARGAVVSAVIDSIFQVLGIESAFRQSPYEGNYTGSLHHPR